MRTMTGAIVVTKHADWSMKRILKTMKCNLSDLNTYLLSTNQHQQRLKETEELFDELSNRLDDLTRSEFK
jgi:hypothetical protein